MQETKRTPDGQTKELLAQMYRNVTMGSESLSTVVSRISGHGLLTDVTGQLEQYGIYRQETAALLEEKDVHAAELSPFKKGMARMGIAMNLWADSSDGHIAEMIARGTELGADTLEHCLDDFRTDGCAPQAVCLCRKIVDFERKEAAAMRKKS